MSLKEYQYKLYWDYFETETPSDINDNKWTRFSSGRNDLGSVAEDIAEDKFHEWELEDCDEIYLLVQDVKNKERWGLFCVSCDINFYSNEVEP